MLNCLSPIGNFADVLALITPREFQSLRFIVTANEMSGDVSGNVSQKCF